MLKEVFEKALSSVLVAAIMGLCALMYSEFETYNEIKSLLDVRRDLENSFIEEVEQRKSIDKDLINRVNLLEKKAKKDSITIQYNSEWVNYWVNLR